MTPQQKEIIREVIITRITELTALQGALSTRFAKDGIAAEIAELHDILNLI